jgi:4-oxalocrotonate tautomerase
MDPRFAEIAEALNIYFDGLYHCDSKILAKVFHPEAHYFTATEGKLLHYDMGQYFPVVDQRVSPASKNEPRADRIISIEFAGPVTAFARVECAIRPRFFTDLLTFVRLEGRWQIVAKVFHFDLREDA